MIAASARRRGDDQLFRTLRAQASSVAPPSGRAASSRAAVRQAYVRQVYGWWSVLLLTAAAPAAYYLHAAPGLVAPLFAAICPGYGIVRTCAPTRAVLQTCLVVGVSLSIVVLVAQALAQAHHLRAPVVLAVLGVLSLIGLALERASHRLANGCWRFSPRW
jgi:uncharacterized membrane protein